MGFHRGGRNLDHARSIPPNCAACERAFHKCFCAVLPTAELCQHLHNEDQEDFAGMQMSVHDQQTQFDEPKPRLQQAEFEHLKTRLNSAQLERTVTALHETLPEAKAREAEATLRRIFARAQRWEV